MTNEQIELLYHYHIATLDAISKSHNMAILDKGTQYTPEQKSALTYEYIKELQALDKVFKEFTSKQ